MLLKSINQRIKVNKSKYEIKEKVPTSDQRFFGPVKFPVAPPRVSPHDIHEQIVQIIVVGRLKEVKTADITHVCRPFLCVHTAMKPASMPKGRVMYKSGDWFKLKINLDTNKLALVNILKCSGTRWLHLKLYNAIQVYATFLISDIRALWRSGWQSVTSWHLCPLKG